MEIRVSEGCIGFWLELWGALPDAFNLSIRTPGGENIPELRLGLQQSVTYSFIYEKSRVTIDSALVEENSGEELILVRIQDPTPGIWTFHVSASGSLYNGNFHMWLPITEFLSTPVYFLNPDPDMTLTEPSMAPEVLSVSTYNAENNSFTQNPAEASDAPVRSVRTYPLPESISPPLTDAVREAAWLPLSLPELWLSFSNGQSLKAITGWRKAGRSAVISYAVPCVHRV